VRRIEVPPPPDPASAQATETFGRITGLLSRHDHGLTATELRAMLDEPIDRVQRALAEAVSARRVRRLGSRRNVRYVLNA